MVRMAESRQCILSSLSTYSSSKLSSINIRTAFNCRVRQRHCEAVNVMLPSRLIMGCRASGYLGGIGGGVGGASDKTKQGFLNMLKLITKDFFNDLIITKCIKCIEKY